MPLPSITSAPARANQGTDSVPASSNWQRPNYKGKKGKGKGKQFAKGAGVAPQGFVGCVGRDQKGRNLCFDWNSKGCDKAPAGGACDNGRHCCFKLNCYKPHAFHVAHASEMPNKE